MINDNSFDQIYAQGNIAQYTPKEISPNIRPNQISPNLRPRKIYAQYTPKGNRNPNPNRFFLDATMDNILALLSIFYLSCESFFYSNQRNSQQLI